jgi:hypothetical protein
MSMLLIVASAVVGVAFVVAIVMAIVFGRKK